MLAKTFEQQDIALIGRWVKEAEKVVLVSHVNADGDACGSLLGTMLQIDSVAPRATAVPLLPNGCPKNFGWLPGAERVLSGKSSPEACRKALAEADIVIALDISGASRLGTMEEAFLASPAHKVLVDHHLDPARGQFDAVVSDSSISSTCELCVWLSKALWGGAYFNRDVATCYYTGLRTDTGGFAFSCHRPSCFAAAAFLIAYDINPAEIHNRITNNFTAARMQFYGFALARRLLIFPCEKRAIFYFSLDDQQRYGVTPEDMEGLVNYTLMMKEIEVGVLLREEKGGTKVSLRSKTGTDVNQIARRLGGGGHTKAAGATFPQPLEATLATVRSLLGVEKAEPLPPAIEK